jgi:hypothetical protein
MNSKTTNRIWRRPTKTRSLPALLAVLLLSTGADACGAAGKGAGSASLASSNATSTGAAATTASSTTPAQSHPPKDSDNDNDKPSNSDYDSDDNFGHAASATDRQAITALVKRYYATAAASDGAMACSLIYSIFAEAIPEDYGQPPGPPGLRGKTCAVVMSKLFKQHHQQLAAQTATLKMARVLIDGNRGWALMSFGTIPERRMLVHREKGSWKIDALLDIGVP